MSLYSTGRPWETFAVRELVEEVCRPLEARLSAQNVKMIVDVPANQMISADRELLRGRCGISCSMPSKRCPTGDARGDLRRRAAERRTGNCRHGSRPDG